MGTFDPTGASIGPDDNARAFAKRVAGEGLDRHDLAQEVWRSRAKLSCERYVVTEECRIANAPVSVFFTADRQSGPTIIKYGSEKIKPTVLPRIVAGEAALCIGMSEPGSGSDLFAAKTKATKTDGGYLINGTKIWTSNAHKADYMIGLFRTSSADEGEPASWAARRSSWT